ncbi:heparinase II/III domain-containing protein [Microvirga zambiensis]|uniref:heparinase II/III domain-containing protein n=1 Tax=Microvirga zambiensis TaxID=1402137 RepID=UPI00191E1054|nr:heparinase II/III family protein [Microvirga zambiensis]
MLDVRRIAPVPANEAIDPSSGKPDGHHIVSNNNRWSKADFEFRDLTSEAWCELRFRIAWHPEESNRMAPDFAAIGVNFLAEDGSGVDFAYVPGLARSQIDPHSSLVAGPDYHGHGSALPSSNRIACTFLVPAPARHLSIAIRSWRNSHPFSISEIELSQHAPPSSTDAEPPIGTAPRNEAGASSRSTWLALGGEPTWLSYGIVSGHPLVVRGQLVRDIADPQGALVRVVFRDAQGQALPLPYHDISNAPGIGAFIEVPVHRQTRRFTLELSPPPHAATVDLGFQLRAGDTAISLATPLEISVGDRLLLEDIQEEATPDVTGFLEQALGRLQPSSDAAHTRLRSDQTGHLWDSDALTTLSTFHDKLHIVQHGDRPLATGGRLALQGLEPWGLPDTLTWTEDPFQSPGWRLAFQSLAWLLPMAGEPGRNARSRAIDFAISWSNANPWGQPADPLSAYPSSVAVRTEVFLHLLALNAASTSPAALKRQRNLFAETIRHGFTLAEIVSQNVFSHSLLQIRTAGALLALACALPRFPMASYWKSIALAQLRSGFDQLLGPDGASVEASWHCRLEAISLALILAQNLEDEADSAGFRTHLSALAKTHLRQTVAITDPVGMLPAFGDMPHGHHYASWLRRLISTYGRSLLADRNLAEELAYPTGSRSIISEEAGIAAFRHYERKPNWAYLCTSFNTQRHENGHFDCTSFVYAANGMRWVADSGGSGLHDAGPARQYLLSSRAHNVAIPDGREQTAGTGWIETDRAVNGARLLSIGTNVHGPDCRHARTFLCLDDLSAVAVLDRFQTSRSQLSFRGFLHFEENVAVALAQAQLAIGFSGKSRLRIIPHIVAGKFDGMAVESGRSARLGELQGFVSHPTGGLQPANVLNYTLSGPGSACGGVVLAANEQGLRKIQELLASPGVQSLFC